MIELGRTSVQKYVYWDKEGRKKVGESQQKFVTFFTVLVTLEIFFYAEKEI